MLFYQYIRGPHKSPFPFDSLSIKRDTNLDFILKTIPVLSRSALNAGCPAVKPKDRAHTDETEK